LRELVVIYWEKTKLSWRPGSGLEGGRGEGRITKLLLEKKLVKGFLLDVPQEKKLLEKG